MERVGQLRQASGGGEEGETFVYQARSEEEVTPDFVNIWWFVSHNRVLLIDEFALILDWEWGAQLLRK